MGSEEMMQDREGMQGQEQLREQFSRTELLLGRDAMERLAGCRVAVFGIGGVGGYVCEALARSGIGAFDLIDNDMVCLSNLNRQIIATHRTIGRPKTEVMKERILEINPEAEVKIHNCFFLPENAGNFCFGDYDYVVDAVDTVSAKLELAVRCAEAGVPLISSMGAGNKLDPTAFRVADIYETRMDPLAKVMRRELKKRGIQKLKVVYSEEQPISVKPEKDPKKGQEACSENGLGQNQDNSSSNSNASGRDSSRRSIPGSTAFVPSAAGLIIAGEVVKDLAAGGGDIPKTEIRETAAGKTGTREAATGKAGIEEAGTEACTEGAGAGRRMNQEDLYKNFEFRDIRRDEAEQAAEIEEICFPPNEACSREMMLRRVEKAPELFLVAADRRTGKLAGFLNGLSTEEERFRDEFFTDAGLYDPKGGNVMLLGLDVLPGYRMQGLARELVRLYCEREKAKGRRKLLLTCLDAKVEMYEKMGFKDLGSADSTWGGEEWHEMEYRI